MDNFWIEHRYTTCNYRLPYHYEKAYQVIFLLAGKIQYQVNDKEYIVEKGGLIVLNTLEDHTLKVLEYPYERYIIQIRPEFFQQEVKYPEVIAVFIKRPPDFSHLLTVSGQAWDYLYGILQEMEAEYLARKSYWELIVGANLRRMFIALFRECPALSMMRVGSGTAVAYNTMNYLDRHFTEDITVESVAAAMFLNKDYLSHVFKDETGYTVIGYVISLRINRAKVLLAESDQSITDIAAACGYTDFSYFSRLFKKHAKASPSEFRKNSARQKEEFQKGGISEKGVRSHDVTRKVSL